MNSIDIIINGGVGIIAASVSSFVTWILSKKKYYTEVDLNLVDKMEKSLEFYKNLSDDNSRRLGMLTERNIALEGEVQELKKQVTNLSINMCMNFACIHRARDMQTKRKSKISNNN